MPNTYEYKKMPLIEGLAFLVQNTGGAFLQLVVTTYFVYFLTDYMLYPASLATGITIFARVADVVICLIAGSMIQHSNMKKYGQYRFWLFFPPLLAIVGGAMCFIEGINSLGVAAVVYSVGYVLNQSAQSFDLTATYGLIPKIAGHDYRNRVLASSRIMQGYYIGSFISSAALVPLCTQFAKAGTTATGWLLASVLYTFINWAAQIMLFKVSAKYDKYDPDYDGAQGGDIPVGQMLKICIKNKPLMAIFLSECFRYAMWTYLASMIAYYFAYNAPGRDGLMGTILTVGSIFGVLAVFAAPMVIGKAGKKVIYNGSNLLCLVAYAILAFASTNKPLVFGAFYFLGLFITSFADAMGPNLYLDAAEYELYNTGNNIRAFASSLTNISIKFSLVIVSVSMMIGFAIMHYSGDSEVTVEMARNMSIMSGAFPAIYAAICLLIMRFYNITDKQAQEFAATNEAKYGKPEE